MSELIREALDEYLRRHADERRQEVLRTNTRRQVGDNVSCYSAVPGRQW